MAVVPMVELPFKQIALSSPAIASGNGFTLTVTLFEFLQPVRIMVSSTVYVVVTVGLTVGLARVEVNPAGNDVQLKAFILPFRGALRVVLPFKQIALSAPAMAAGNGFTVTVTLWVLWHPVLMMVSTTV